MATPHNANDAETERLQSVRRTLALLEALASRPGGATPKELSQVLGVHLSTCYRILNTLASGGYITRSGEGQFLLGPRIAYLNHTYETSIQPSSETIAFLHALQMATGETVMLNQLDGDDVIVAAVIPGSRPGAHKYGYVGMAAPAHLIAAGRALLAWLSEAHVAAYMERREYEPHAHYPMRGHAALRAELEAIRRDGYAVDRGEGTPNLCCIAAPVVENARAASAVSIVAPCSRLTADRPGIVAAVLAVAQAIGAVRAAHGPDGAYLACQEAGDDEKSQVEASFARLADAMSRVGQPLTEEHASRKGRTSSGLHALDRSI